MQVQLECELGPPLELVMNNVVVLPYSERYLPQQKFNETSTDCTNCTLSNQ